MEDILTVQEVAQYLKVSQMTVWRWCKKGKIKAFKAGRSWRIPRSAIEQLLHPALETDEPATSTSHVDAATGLNEHLPLKGDSS